MRLFRASKVLYIMNIFFLSFEYDWRWKNFSKVINTLMNPQIFILDYFIILLMSKYFIILINSWFFLKLSIIIFTNLATTNLSLNIQISCINKVFKCIRWFKMIRSRLNESWYISQDWSKSASHFYSKGRRRAHWQSGRKGYINRWLLLD